MNKLSTNIKRTIFAAVVAIGCLLTWVKVMGISVSGTENTYIIILCIAAGVAALLAFLAEQNKAESPAWLFGVVGGYGAAICTYAAYTYYTTFSEMNGRVFLLWRQLKTKITKNYKSKYYEKQ